MSLGMALKVYAMNPNSYSGTSWKTDLSTRQTNLPYWQKLNNDSTIAGWLSTCWLLSLQKHFEVHVSFSLLVYISTRCFGSTISTTWVSGWRSNALCPADQLWGFQVFTAGSVGQPDASPKLLAAMVSA